MAIIGLPIGTQASFIRAGRRAAALGGAINVLFTIRWTSLFSDRAANPLRVPHPPERIRYLVELLRKWLTGHGLPVHYVWVREIADAVWEHWHFACHVPPALQRPFADYVAHLTGEPRRARPRPAGQRTEGEFAFGEIASWHPARDTSPKRDGFFLMAYLGEGEPS